MARSFCIKRTHYPVQQENHLKQLSTCTRKVLIRKAHTYRTSDQFIYCKKWGSKYSERNRSALLLIMLVILLFYPSVEAYKDVNVTWDIKSNPIRFGTTAKLACRIQSFRGECHTLFGQWYGGQDHKLLCRNTSCRNPKKYSEEKEIGCTFTLQIHNFSEKDVNCEYSCYLGTFYQRKKLALDEQHFAYVPNIQDILHRNKTLSNLTDPVKHFQVVIELTKVYPVPVCNTTFQEDDISRFVDVMTTYKGIFYSLIFNISYSQSKCSGQLKVQCKIGNILFIPYDENLSLCLGKESVTKDGFSNFPGRAVVVGAMIAVLFFLITVIVRQMPMIATESLGAYFRIKYEN